MVQAQHHAEQARIVQAAAKGDVNEVKRILAQDYDWSSVNKLGFDPDDPSIPNQTAVIAAAKARHPDVLRVLLQHNADPDAVNWVGQTAMYWAQKANDREMIALLKRQQNQLRLDADLIESARSGDLKRTNDLLHKGARVDISWFWTHLPYSPDMDRVNYLDTPLIAAAKGGNVKIIQKFLQLHAKVNDRNFLSQTPLIGASQEGHVEAASLLLNCGAQIDVVDCNGMSSLMAACEHGHDSVVRLLLARKPNVNLQSSGSEVGLTALSLAEKGEIAASDQDKPRYQRIVQMIKAAGGKTFPIHWRIAQ